jgi:arylsulfatase A-like enzyme
MLTALDGLSHQVYFPLEKMGPEVETMANLLRQAGYFSAGFTAGGYLSSTYGFAKGFDSYQEIRLRGDRAIRYDESERLAEMAREWISRHNNKKFFLFLHTYQPHDPYTNLSPLGKMFLAKGAEWDRIRMDDAFEGKGRFGKAFTPEERENIKALYAGEIRYTDETLVKPVLETLKELDLYDRTLVIITSDHGEEFYEHEAWLHDHSLYEEGIKIPLMIKFPLSEDKGLRLADPVRITDILPTVLDYLDFPSSKESFDGSSLIPIIKGRESDPRFVISDLALRQFEEAPTVVAAVEGSKKLIINHKIVSPYVKKTSLEYSSTQVELYDLEVDPGETRNLVQDSQYRRILNEMLRKVTTLYVEAEKRRREKAAADIDSSLEERLRALGYIK